MRKILLLSVFLIVTGFTAFSQITTSNIKGLVTDSQGEALPGAAVVAVHTPTGTNYGVATNLDGRYNLLNMRVGGPYTVTITFVGYKEQVFNNVFLDLGLTKVIDVVLSADSEELDAVVITTDGAGTFGSDRTGAETSVGKRELTRMPTITRSASDYTRMEPTASGGSFGGRNDQFNNFSLDGAIFNNPFGLDAATPGGQTDSQPVSIDAIDQIQVSTAPYDVTQSGFTGASVNAVTKSGTNEFHGTVYGFFRNEDLTGGKIKGEDVFKPSLKQNQYGVSIGGPIVENKLFFFANFEKDERTDLGSAFTPNRGTGSINESRVTVEDLNLVQNILSQVSIGNGEFYNPGAYEGFTYGANSTKGIFKLDWNINDKNRLAFIYNFLNAAKEKPAHPTALGFRGPNANTLQFENAGYEINNKIQSFQVELNSTLSDEATNKLQIGYTHFDDFRNALSTPAPSITLLNGGSNYIIAGHEPFSINNKLDQKVFQITNNMNFFKGDHNYTIGFSFEKFQFDNSFNLGAYGAQGVFFPTGDISSFRNLDAQGEADLVAFYQGLFNSAISTHNSLSSNAAGSAGGFALAETNVGQLAFYLQDEWNVNENFKLTYGVRFDKPLFFDSSEKAQDVIDTGFVLADIPYFNPNTGESVLIDNTKMPTNKVLISPRIGFNWDVNGNNVTQVRGGSGLFTGRLPFVWIGNQIAAPDAFFLQAVDPDFQFPQVWRTNIGVDHRLENGLTLTGDLSFTKDINGAHVQHWGLNNPTGTLQGVDNRPIYTAADILTFDGNPGDGAFVFTNSDKGQTFNASFKAQKSFDNGIYASVAYSYLNSKDVNSIEAEITSDAFAGNPAVGNVNNDVLSYSKYGDTHRFIGLASKQFKYGGDKWATTISTFFEYAKGGRFNYTYGGDLNGDGSSINDLLYIPTASEIGEMQFSGGATEAQAFEEYIQQDDYLSENRGQYAQRYGATAPWRGKWDLKILQDYNFKVSGDKTNTIQLSFDILNVGNLINSDWGVVQQPNNVQPLGVTVDASSVPTYTFNPDLTETFVYDSSLLSRWQAQFGLRYIF
ncbi:TonB-dependent receptor [Urechidicola croceus]|uniref:TonB-dependent receptor n=1 Tax=Urechidicola croceus TaxID=1850246 RepID=A0A1D8P505_9FLAO|nr:carboxypeptidase regulatory-like domain-containing protein [Urechidicola croceus]AOW19634.1 TonB-dependent receptor [Urechidicola croceus]